MYTVPSTPMAGGARKLGSSELKDHSRFPLESIANSVPAPQRYWGVVAPLATGGTPSHGSDRLECMRCQAAGGAVATVVETDLFDRR